MLHGCHLNAGLTQHGPAVITRPPDNIEACPHTPGGKRGHRRGEILLRISRDLVHALPGEAEHRADFGGPDERLTGVHPTSIVDG